MSPAELLLMGVRQIPPWMILSALVGMISAAAFFVVAGISFRSLPAYLLLGLSVAPLCHLLGTGLLPTLPPPFMIGEVDLAVVAVGTWLFLTIARLLRL